MNLLTAIPPRFVLMYAAGILVTLVILACMKSKDDDLSDLLILSMLFPLIPVYFLVRLITAVAHGASDFFRFDHEDRYDEKEDHIPHPSAPYGSRMLRRRDETGRWTGPLERNDRE